MYVKRSLRRFVLRGELLWMLLRGMREDGQGEEVCEMTMQVEGEGGCEVGEERKERHRGKS